MSSPPQEPILFARDRMESAKKPDDAIPVRSVLSVESTPAATGGFADIDGGLRGWLTVLGAWLFAFSMIGVLLAFGNYQTFYQDHWLTNYSQSNISWIGGLQLFLELFLSVFGGMLVDAGHWRIGLGFGSVLFIFTFFMLSFCKPGQYVPIILSQGVGMGVGLGFAYLPVLSLASEHFTKRRSFAMGIITTGGSVGGFAFSALTSHLSISLGFAWMVRVSAFVSLGCILSGCLLISKPKKKLGKEESTPSSTTQATVPATALEIEEKEKAVAANDEEPAVEIVKKPRTISQLLRDPAYLAIIFSAVIDCLGLYFPMFAIQSFALEHNISPGLSAWLLSIINIANVLGRTIPNWLADDFGTLEVYVPCTVITSILVFALGVATKPASIVVVCILYGFFSGSVVSLYYPSVCALDPDIVSAGVRVGLASVPVSVSWLVGTPIAESIVGVDNHWWRGIVFSGTMIMGGAALLAFALVVERKRKRKLPIES